MNNVELMNQISQLQQEYYNHNTKKTFFKKNQKLELAGLVSNNFNMNDLLKSALYIIPNTNKIYFDYPVFKTFANPENYVNIVNYLIQLLNECIHYHNSYEMHLNLKTFSISAVERYRTGIEWFCTECLKNNMNYNEKIVHMHIYHTPSVIDTIATILDRFIHPDVKKKIIKYTKPDSEHNIQLIMSYCSSINSSNNIGLKTDSI